MSYSVIRTHEICAGHRVVGHESKCRMLHGHNYKFHFKVAPLATKAINTGAGSHIVEPGLDNVGRVIDFSVVKSTLCEWLEKNWDHKFLHWERDDLIEGLKAVIQQDCQEWPQSPSIDAEDREHFFSSLVSLPFNPTAENLAAYIVEVIGPELLNPYGVELVECRIEETSKCHVEYTK